MQPQDDDLFLETENDSANEQDNTWLVLIVDDDKAVHEVTRYSLGMFRFMHKGITILSAYSGSEALALIRQHPGVALVLLDVVMETRDAGLRCADAIRNEIRNNLVRIILRTGQPGDAPQLEVMLKYDINDYKEKAELTEMKLLASVTAALRSFRDLTTIENYRLSLEEKVRERTHELHHAHQRLAEVQQRQERELLEARALQQAMLPKAAPVYEWCDIAALQESAVEVGGDYYDFFPQADGSVIIACGDATGHGLKAGMMVTLTKALLTVMVKSHAPDETLRDISAIIKSMRLGNVFMGLTLAHSTHHSVTIASAGMPPVLLRREDGRIEEVVHKSMPLGAITNFPYQSTSHELFGGDMLVFSSDGFAESFNAEGEMLGDRALGALLETSAERNSEAFVRHCAAKEEAFRGGAERHDDMTIVAVRIL